MKEEEYILLTNLTKLRIVLQILRDTMADKFLTDQHRKDVISILSEIVPKYEIDDWNDGDD